MALGEEVGDAYISIHADTSAFRRELAALQKRFSRFAKEAGKLDTALKKNQRFLNQNERRMRSFGRAMDRTDRKAGALRRSMTRLNNSFKRMDGTVKLVIFLIATAGSMMAALGSAAAGAGVALAAAGALAFAALSPLLGLLAPLIYGIKLVKDSLTDEFGDFTTDKIAGWAPEAAAAMERFGEIVHSIDASALFKEWNTSLADFVNTLGSKLELDGLAQAIGGAFSQLTDGLTEVLNSPVWTNFAAALEGPLTEALGNFLAAVGPLTSTLLQFMTAAAPFAVQLSEMFLAWAENLEKAFAASVASGEFASFMQLAVDSLSALLDLAGSLGDALGVLFVEAAPYGIQFLEMITGFVDQFTAWMQTFEGQSALNTWFNNALVVMEAVFELAGSLGSVLAELVTPSVVRDLVEFLGALGEVLPVVGQLIAILSEAHILDIFTAAIAAFGAILEPLVAPLTNFVTILSDELIGVLETLEPQFTILGEAMGTILDALAPVLPVLAELVVLLVESLAPVIGQLAPMFGELVALLAPALGQIMGLLGPLIPVILDLAMQLIGALWPAFEALIPAVLRIIEALAPFISQLVDMLAPILVPIIDAVVQLATTLLDALLPVFEALIPIIEILVTTVLTPLMAVVQLILPLIVDLVKIALLPLQVIFEILTPIIQFFAEVIELAMDNAITPIITTIGNWISKNDAIRNNIQTVIDKVKSFSGFLTDLKDNAVDMFSQIWDAISGFSGDVKETFDQIADAIGGAFVDAFNMIARAWNNTIGSFSATIPDWVPGIGGKTFNVPDMPTFAAGTIANTPTAGIFGEAGAEALVPLNRPLSQVDPSVRGLSAIAQGLVPMGPQIAEGAIVINTKSGDGRLIAESVLDRIVAYSR